MPRDTRGWPPPSPSNIRSHRIFLQGNVSGLYDDNWYLFADVAGAHTLLPQPPVKPGGDFNATPTVFGQFGDDDTVPTIPSSPSGPTLQPDPAITAYLSMGTGPADQQLAPKFALFTGSLRIFNDGTAGADSDLEFSFDGANLHGVVKAGESLYYEHRYEAGITLRHAGVAAVGTLTLTGNVQDGDEVKIGSKTYTFQAALTDADGNVQVGGDTGGSIANLVAAINLTPAGAGTQYAASMTAGVVTAVVGAGTTMDVTAKELGTVGNAITTTDPTDTGFVMSWATGTLLGGTGAPTPFRLEGW